jgi:hypothetical protein
MQVVPDFTGQATRQTPIRLQKGSPLSDVLLLMGNPTAVSTHPYSGQVIFEFQKGKVYTYNGKVEGIVNPKIPAKAQVVPSGVVIPHPNLRWGGLYYASGKWHPIREEEERFSLDASGAAVPRIAEDGSRRGELDIRGREKTVYVAGYFRPDGTYVKSHWRSRHLPAPNSVLTERMIVAPATSKGRGSAVPAGGRKSRR